MEVLTRCWLDTPVGAALGLQTSGGLAGLFLGEERAEGSLSKWRRRWAPEAPLEEDPAPFAVLRAQLEAYFAGELQRFDVPLDLRGTDFQREVWAGLRRIPFGKTRTYAELASAIGRPSATRAVGAGNGANPVPILVPCHRVTAKGGLGGFSAGLARKRALLELEGVLLPLTE